MRNTHWNCVVSLYKHCPTAPPTGGKICGESKYIIRKHKVFFFFVCHEGLSIYLKRPQAVLKAVFQSSLSRM